MTKIALFCLCLITALLTTQNHAVAAERDKVGLMVMLDMSSSTKYHRQKLKSLAPIIKNAMEKSQCDFKVSVGNIAYSNFKKNNLTPWGKPAFVTKDTPNAEGLIWERISDPESVLFPGGSISGDDEVPRGNEERTYSSMVEAIEQNRSELEETISVGVLLLTDTAPAFEIFEPHQALERIYQSLGARPFIPGMIRPDFKSDMILAPSDCRLDIPGQQQAGQVINTAEWMYKNIESMDEFIHLAGGEKWNICDADYDESLERYLQKVLSLSGCLYMM